MAGQLAERFKIPGVFSNAQEMLTVVSPDVVHITTPPQSHYSLGKQCLESGSHVYLEKPFTITAGEAESLIRVVESCDLKITAGHNLQFTPETLEMRQRLAEGFLGGIPVHLESHFSYDLGDTTYVSALLGNRQHWVRQLPGQLLHNIISHGIAKLVEFLDDDLIEITATAHQSEQLRRLGADEVLDELSVLIRDKIGTTAFFCFSTQIKGLNQLRIYGPTGSLTTDIVAGTVVRTPNQSYKSYLTYFIPPLRNAREHFQNATRNVANFVRRRLYQDFGMKELIERFYDSIRKGAPLPIPYREIILTARIMDEIFAQVYPGSGPEVRNQRSEVSAPSPSNFVTV